MTVNKTSAYLCLRLTLQHLSKLKLVDYLYVGLSRATPGTVSPGILKNAGVGVGTPWLQNYVSNMLQFENRGLTENQFIRTTSSKMYATK